MYSELRGAGTCAALLGISKSVDASSPSLLMKEKREQRSVHS